MIKVKMENNNGEIVEYNACEVLQHINQTEQIVILNSRQWNKDVAKTNFLMAKGGSYISAFFPVEPLNEEAAKLAVEEYKVLMGN